MFNEKIKIGSLSVDLKTDGPIRQIRRYLKDGYSPMDTLELMLEISSEFYVSEVVIDDLSGEIISVEVSIPKFFEDEYKEVSKIDTELLLFTYKGEPIDEFLLLIYKEALINSYGAIHKFEDSALD